MARKTKNNEIKLKSFILPSSDNSLRKFIESKKTKMMEQTVKSIEYALEENLPVVELFQFRNSEFVILLPKNEFMDNLDHIYEYYMENEMYELCGKVVELKKKISSIITLNEI